MARKRMIDPSIWDDEDVGQLSDMAFRLFVCSISNADDDGKLEASAVRMRGLAYRYQPEITTDQVDLALQELSSKLRSYHRYKVNNRWYAKLFNWHSYQTIKKPYPSTIPEPESSEFGTGGEPVENRYGTGAPKERKKEENLKEEEGKEDNPSSFDCDSNKKPVKPQPEPKGDVFHAQHLAKHFKTEMGKYLNQNIGFWVDERPAVDIFRDLLSSCDSETLKGVITYNFKREKPQTNVRFFASEFYTIKAEMENTKTETTKPKEQPQVDPFEPIFKRLISEGVPDLQAIKMAEKEYLNGLKG
jgi:hypothetical protein